MLEYRVYYFVIFMNKAVSGSHFFSCVYLHFSCQHKQWLEHKLAFRSFYQCIGNTRSLRVTAAVEGVVCA